MVRTWLTVLARSEPISSDRQLQGLVGYKTPARAAGGSERSMPVPAERHSSNRASVVLVRAGTGWSGT